MASRPGWVDPVVESRYGDRRVWDVTPVPITANQLLGDVRNRQGPVSRRGAEEPRKSFSWSSGMERSR